MYVSRLLLSSENIYGTLSTPLTRSCAKYIYIYNRCVRTKKKILKALVIYIYIYIYISSCLY